MATQAMTLILIVLAVALSLSGLPIIDLSTPSLLVRAGLFVILGIVAAYANWRDHKTQDTPPTNK